MVHIKSPGKYETRDGRIATITEVNPSGDFMHATGTVGDMTINWRADGRWWRDGESRNDIVGRVGE